MQYGVTENAYRNNAASLVDGSGIVVTSIQAIEQDFQYFDFEITVDTGSPAEKAQRSNLNWLGKWSFGTTYATGDSVRYAIDGNYYRAITTGSGHVPSSSPVNWTPIEVLSLPYNASWGHGFGVALETRATPGGPYSSPLVGNCPISSDWSIPDGYWDTYPNGTVREVWRSYSTILLTREGVDPGFNPFVMDGDDPVNATDEPRSGPRYTFELNGNELLAKDVDGKQIVKVALGPDIPYPMRLTARMPGADAYIRNVFFGGNLKPSTILSKRDQVAAFGSVPAHIYLRLRQVSRTPGVKGLPYDIVAPPL
jgi:hypothetical protein